MGGFVTDLRLAARWLVRHPTFSVVAVLTLALGIGANTAVFTLVDSVLIRPLPYPGPQELLALQHLGREGRDELPMSQGLYVLYREQASSLAGVGLYASTSVNLVVDGEPERLPAQVVTPDFFEVLQVSTALGRGFTAEEGRPDGEPVVVLSDAFWRSRFGGSPSVLGQSLDLNGQLRTIVGVMPPDFGFPDRQAQLWVPMIVDPAQAPLAAFGAGGVARMAPGRTQEAVEAEVAGLIGRLGELFPEDGAAAFLGEVGLRARIMPLKTALVGDLTTTLWILLGTVAFVLLIACANVANLLLVRAEARQRELALRVAVGAGRNQILRWFLSESLVLAAVGGVLGIGVAALAVHASLGMVPSAIPRGDEIGMDLRVMAFTTAITLGCALFFGFFPLARHGADDLAVQLREGAPRGSTGSRGQNRLRSGLVVTQVALALVLLIGSGLMVRSFQALRALDPGFDSQGILTARITVPTSEIPSPEATATFFRQVREQMAAVPGVESVGLAQSVPLGGGLGYFSIEVEDHPRGPQELPIFARNNQVEAGYLETLGIDLLEGRTFQPGDGAEGARAVVVSRSFARQWWPGASPLGRRMRLGIPDEEWYTIVGVVADAHYQSLETTPDEMVYWPLTVGPAASPQPARALDIAIRTAGDPLALFPVLREEVRALGPRIPVSNPRTMETILSDATARTSFTMVLLGSASGIALLLGLVGIYSVISYVVSQRTREIGIRMAIGATGGEVRWMVIRQGLILAGVGVAIGLVAAGALSSFMASILYGVSATDPLTYGLLTLALVGVASLASWIPARRAAGVDPALALRAD